MSTYRETVPFGFTSEAIWLDVPEGRPSSVTSVAVYEADSGDDSTAEAATTGSASIETNPNTTVDANSGPGANPRTLNVAATTGFVVGRQYLVTGANGQSEWIVPTEINSGVSVICKHPLHNSYVSGDTVESVRISISLDDDYLADEDNLSSPDGNPRYRVRWVYVYDSTSYVTDTYFDIVRYEAKHSVTSMDVELRMSGWLNNLPTYSRATQGMDIINAAFDDVTSDLHNIQQPHWGYNNRERMDELVIMRTLMNWARSRYYNGKADLEEYDTARRDYFELLDKRVRVVSNVPRQTDTGAGAEVQSALPIAVR